MHTALKSVTALLLSPTFSTIFVSEHSEKAIIHSFKKGTYMEYGYKCAWEKDGTDSFLSIYFISCYECCCGIFRCMTVVIFPCITIENTQQTSKIKSLKLALIYPQKENTRES